MPSRPAAVTADVPRPALAPTPHAPPRASRPAAWLWAAATVLPAWLHIAWLLWVVPLLAVFVSENVFGLLNALWVIPVGVSLYGSARGWIPGWAIWTFIVLPYGVLLLRAGVTTGD
jgi:hypothetical protein